MTDAKGHIVVIGASAGGIEAISALIERLPADFPVPVVVALHARAGNALAEIFGRATRLNVTVAASEQDLEPGHLYVCPGGGHSYFAGGKLVSQPVGDTERFRPSVDLLFKTMAEEYDDRGIAVVMSGMLDDGTKGADHVHEHGATMLVQSLDEAIYKSMPRSIIIHDHPSDVLDAVHLAERLIELVAEPG